MCNDVEQIYFRCLSGGRGIRTPETRKGPNGFQDRRIRPLCHPSKS